MGKRVGVDVGGTFTDIVVFDEGTQRIEKTVKIATDPRALIPNLVSTIRASLDGPEAAGDLTVLHGTTVGINTLLQLGGARVALLTTEGFRDVYELGRQWRGSQVYDLFAARPPLLVPRHRIFEIRERIGSRGEIVVPLDEAEVDRVVEDLRRLEVEAVAVCFLFSFLNTDHERRVGDLLRKALPGVPISLSSEVAPEFREYERTSTVVVDAYIKPAVARYLADLSAEFEASGSRARTYVMRSGGGLASLDEVARLPVQSIFSGPVAGVMGACFLGQALGWPNLITLDMGGTSTDMALVLDGQPLLTKDREVASRAINVPMVEVNSIGSGGGSVGSVFAGKVVKVGPRSAGAVPGPACYGRGGDVPTLTDAWLQLGHLPDVLLDGQLPLRRDLAEDALRAAIGKPLGLDPVEAASAMVQVAVSQSYDLMRLITIERGYDPSEFQLVTFGGAGPVYAAAVARDLGIPRVCVPAHPGLFSAFGLLTTDIVQDFSETRIARADRVPTAEIDAIWRRLEDRARAAGREAMLHRYVDLRYSGQAYELMVPAPAGEWGDRVRDALLATFHQLHEKRFGLKAESEPIEYVAFRVRASIAVPRPRLDRGRARAGSPAVAATRPVHFETVGFQPTPVFRRADLRSGDIIEGPGVVEEYDTTCVVFPGQRLEVDEFGNLIIHAIPK